VVGPSWEIIYIIHRVEDVTDYVRLNQKGIEQRKLTEQLTSRTEQMEAEIYRRAQEVNPAKAAPLRYCCRWEWPKPASEAREH
jgi:hypothetical protein